MNDDTRGQAYTLEGVISAILIASALIIGLQAVDPAPWTDSDGINEEEFRTQVEDLLAASSDRENAMATDTLTAAVTCIDDDGELVEEAFEPDGAAFGERMDALLGTENYRIYVEYEDADEIQGAEEPVYESTAASPSTSSITVTRQVTLYDATETHEFDTDCEPRGVSVSEFDDGEEGDEENFYAAEHDDEDQLFTVVTVRVVVW